MTIYQAPYWFLISAVSIGLLAVLGIFLRSKGKVTKWYDWAIITVGLLLGLFALQNYFGSVSEWENQAATMFLTFMGIPALILFAVAGVLIAKRKTAA
ncbi:MAG: dehalogenase [Dehalogenimonas sp.]